MAKGILAGLKQKLFPGFIVSAKSFFSQPGRFTREFKKVVLADLFIFVLILLVVLLLVVGFVFFIIITVYIINTSGFVVPPFRSGGMGPGGCYPMCWPMAGSITQVAPHGQFNTLNGIDIDGGDNGVEIYATHDGTAICAWDPASLGGGDVGWGLYTIITSDCIDNFQTYYAHLERCPDNIPEGVEVPVRAGDLVGYQDSTGYSTGPHLHYEVHDGDPSYATIYNYVPPYTGVSVGEYTEGCMARDEGGGDAPPTP